MTLTKAEIYERYKQAILEFEERDKRWLKSYQFQLRENHQLKSELDEAIRTIEVYIKPELWINKK